MNDKVIVEDIRKGSRKQLAFVYRTYRSEFIAWLTSNYQCSRDEARDIYQVSILTLQENIVNDKLKQLSSNLKTYLFAIGKHKFQEYRREENRISRHADAENLELEEISSMEALDKEHKLQLMETSLDELGDPCRTLLELYYFHGMTMDEIADRLGYKNRDTTKNLKCKCIVRLRKIFHDALSRQRNLEREY